MQLDPRTVARDIPGIVDETFPQLTAGTVAHLNTQIDSMEISPVPANLLSRSKLQKAMLFELAYTVGEHLLQGEKNLDWDKCFKETIKRQRVYFDAKLPDVLEAHDAEIAVIVGSNLAKGLNEISHMRGEKIISRPVVPGLEWVSSGVGDFSVGHTLIEVKCTIKRFSSADYRQVAIYWLLSYAASVEGRGEEWRDFILLNPRNGEKLTMKFDDLLSMVGGGRTKIDALQLFQSLIGSRLRS
ncbi:hypothetical protein [Achromobacter kerstersii]|uniref:Uncharacterized protein n=1 Tax=Achromobacter kerstersii TaxID=1353890 RepID=A0A6S7AMR0_9BURK|nr:hypothetical protein [Achromobacter kerstersii]CAB3676908.1 hypothetical protein LMG3441_01376 [Achromobacter kerstersii]